MKQFIAYFRVSTVKQGKSALGLDSQKSIVESYVEKEGGKIINCFTEIESGKNSQRPALLKALDLCKKTGACLIVAKLDRLSRSVSFISSLTDSNVDFICCDFAAANKFTLHLFAAVAEYERDLISHRTKMALQAKKNQGFKLGRPHATFTDEMINKASDARRVKASENENNKRAVSMIKALVNKNLSLTKIAKYLNENGFQTSKGGLFSAEQVKRLVARYNLNTSPD